MGCLNSGQGFEHWFGNIHLSGPCNRSCYFCIGQHMMALDKLNNLDTWPLAGIEDFVKVCLEHDVREVNVTGTNTDPLLYRHTARLHGFLRLEIPGVQIGIRTNGAGIVGHRTSWNSYDKASISLPSFDQAIYEKMMGSNIVPDLETIISETSKAIKVNVVLSPFLTDLHETLDRLDDLGVLTVNLREPYGQPHVGDPLAKMWRIAVKTVHGMPTYRWRSMLVTYWDVHYCHVESVNLYANGRISLDYPITRGYDDQGNVIPQEQWGPEHKRHVEQWVS